jgi:anti-sigma-K factor RskA
MKVTEDTDLLVGEYVLGTLEREERRRLEEIAGRERSNWQRPSPKVMLNVEL